VRCASCPVPPDQSCQGECPGLGRLCGQIAAGDDSAARLVLFKAGAKCPATQPPPADGPPKPPPLLTRAVNFLGAVVSHAAAGRPKSSPETVAARLAVCGTCPQRLPGGVCAGCGCNLTVKASWADTDCPKGLWPATAPPAPPGPASG
jgi:hypothetical protein